MKTSLLILLTCSVAIQISAQQFSIEGTVRSAQTDEPLPFATLSLSEGRRGTISNAKGQFRLILRETDRADSLRVSYVGYHSQVIKMSSLHSGKLNIRLTEKEEKLDEVVVTSLTANQILANALDSIPVNYFKQPYTSRGFYRLSSRKNEKYVHLSEAVFDLYRSKVPKDEDLFRLDTWRGITDEREASGIDVGMRPDGVFNLDVVNSKGFLKTFNKRKFLKEHTFVLEGEYSYDDREVYLISFDQKEGVKNLGLKGHFYIAKDDFAFLEMDYGLSPKSVQYYKFSIAYRVLMELFGIHIKVLDEKTRARYHKVDGTYYLKDVSETADFRFKSQRSYFNFVLNMKLDYLVSEITLEEPERFEDEDVLSQGKLIEYQDIEYDSLFWQDYTIVLPESDFNEIAGVIGENNKANDTKKEVRKNLKKYPKELNARVDSILTFYHRRGLFHGNALIESQGEVVLNKVYPFEDQDLGPTSRFRIGSTSKTFTSMLILMLEKEGKLKLSDSIARYIPYYTHGKVTIEQLLTHQSGIPNYLSKGEYLLEIFKERYPIDELIERFCSDSLEFKPGESFRYSNSGYVLLARIAEIVGEKPFGELLSERIFEPLGMKDTSFGELPGVEAVEGYYYGQPETNYPIENVIGAGGIVSTTEDLLIWSKTLEGEGPIQAAIVREAWKPRAEYKDWEAGYGYGWMIDKYLFKTSKKHKIVYHPGTDIAFYSMFLKQPDEQITIVLLSNTGDFPRFEMSELILEVLN